MSDLTAETVLDELDWQVHELAYRSRVEAFLQGRRDGRPHPVWDFLFSYYSLRPRQLRCWHPGFGVVLTGSGAERRYRGRRGYTVRDDGVTVSDAYLRSRLDTVQFVARLLRSTAARPARMISATTGTRLSPWKAGPAAPSTYVARAPSRSAPRRCGRHCSTGVTCCCGLPVADSPTTGR